MRSARRWIVVIVLSSAHSEAQVTLDGTLGRAGALPGPDYAITADFGQQVGGNLFHSFQTFSIQHSESATFSGPPSVSNINRVTGGQISTIDGALRSTIPGAHLYLLNPAGVLFGEHARLEVPGSVHVSTADHLRLSDSGRFDARTTNISGSLIALNPPYLDAAGQLSARCGTGDPEERSRFIIQGRGALPPSPEEELSAPVSRCIPQPHASVRPLPHRGRGASRCSTRLPPPWPGRAGGGSHRIGPHHSMGFQQPLNLYSSLY